MLPLDDLNFAASSFNGSLCLFADSVNLYVDSLVDRTKSEDLDRQFDVLDEALVEEDLGIEISNADTSEALQVHDLEFNTSVLEAALRDTAA